MKQWPNTTWSTPVATSQYCDKALDCVNSTCTGGVCV